jgi:prepilin-type N-terminal cleavage/methylation domain-containing protein
MQKPVPHRHRGFTFTEILFAVLILGIGFILIAAIFPVAIRQTQTSGEETVAATIAKEGVAYLNKYSAQTYWTIGNTAPYVPDGKVHPIGPNALPSDGAALTASVNTQLWPLISGNLILPSDDRYAWVPMYRQGVGTGTGKYSALPYVQLIVIGVEARNRTNYDGADLLSRPAGTGAPTLMARPLQAVFTPRGAPGSPDTVQLSDLTGNNFIGCANEGAFIVVANDANADPAVQATNGWIFRLGNFISSTTGANASSTWELAPGNDLLNATAFPGAGSAGTAGSPVVVLIVGAGYDDSNQTTTTYSGPVQDVAAYTTFINVQ